MADIVYFESNNVAMFNLSASSIVGVTTAGTFDPLVVDSSIQFPAGAFNTSWSAGMPIANGGPTLTTKFYGHFDYYAPGAPNFITGGSFIEFVNATGQVIFKVRALGAGTFKASYFDGTTFVDIGPTINLTWSGLTTYDFDFTPGAAGSFALRANNGSVPVLSVSNFNVAVNAVAEVRVCNPNFNVTANVSQGVLANFDLRGCKLAVPRISGNGFYTAGTGTYTDVNNAAQNQTTGIGFTVAGDRKTFTKPNISTTGMVIHNVSVNAACAVSGGVVTGARSVARRASADYSNPNYSTLARGIEQRILPVYLDPSTGLAWTVSNFNATEFGIQAQ